MSKINKFSYKKFDLHIHTFKKEDSLDNKKTISIDKNNVDAFYEKLIENKIKLIAITNHNYFNYKNYCLIKKRLENIPKKEQKIKVLPGIEMSLFYFQNKEKKQFHMNLIIDDKYKDLNSFEEKLNDFYKKKIKNPKNIDKLISFLSKNNIKGILILDHSKASSKIKKQEMNDDFWFYFDFFEGNLAFEKPRLHREMKKIEERLKLSNPKVANSIFGTDNINFQNYPNRCERIGWTGTFYGVEETFDGLRIAIYFKHLIKKPKKDFYINYKDDKDFLPHLNKIVIEDIEDISLDRGLNVIYGRRGSGKTHFLKKITNKLEFQKIIGFKKINQNEIITIIEKLKIDDAIFSNLEKNESYSKKEWDKKIIKDQIQKFNNIFLDNANELINELNYETKVKEISNIFKEIVNIEFLNINFKIEEKLISKINVYFSKFNYEFLNEKRDLQKLISLNWNTDFIKKSFKNNFNYQAFIKEVFSKIKQNLEKINFSFKESNIERKTNFELKDRFKSHFNGLIQIIEKNKLLLEKIFNSIKDFFSKNIYFKLTFKDVKIFSSKITSKFSFSEDSLFNLGKYFKIKNLKNLLENIFWKSEFQNNLSLKFKESFNIIWEYQMENENIDNLSPGQRANKYINKIFEDVSTKVLLVDQPEDQLDAESTTNSIIVPILNRYDELIEKGIQIILVSHDPKIVINAGPINLIHAWNENDEYKIENISLIDFINNEKNIKIVDGKKEFVHGRSEMYGRNKN